MHATPGWVGLQRRHQLQGVHTCFTYRVVCFRCRLACVQGAALALARGRASAMPAPAEHARRCGAARCSWRRRTADAARRRSQPRANARPRARASAEGTVRTAPGSLSVWHRHGPRGMKSVKGKRLVTARSSAQYCSVGPRNGIALGLPDSSGHIVRSLFLFVCLM